MGWDQPSDQQNGQSGAPTAIESQTTKPATGNESLRSLFVADFLLPSDNAPGTNTAKPALSAPPREASNQLAAPQRIAAPETYSAPRTTDLPVNFAAPPRFNAEPQSLAAPPRGYAPQNFAPNYADRATPQYAGQQPPRNNDMTYRSMSRAAQLAQAALDGQQPPMEQMAGMRNNRRLFQPQPVAQRRQELPPGAPQEQPRQRIFKGLFKGPDQPVAPKNEPMQKHEFLAKTETGVIKEMALPAKFKETPKDPTMPPGSDPIAREFTVPGTRSHVSLYEGRELSADEQKSMKAILAKPGKLQPNTPAYDEACMLMGAGYHTFVNNPQVTVGKFNGRDALILTDEDPKQGLVGHTIIVPSDKGQFAYAISYDGTKADFPAVKKGLDSIQWRPTPDVVAPPAPGPKK